MISSIASKRSRITPAQRRTQVDRCHEHLSWLVNDWLKDENNYEILNRIVFDTIQLDLNVHSNVYRREAGLLMSYTNASI